MKKLVGFLLVLPLCACGLERLYIGAKNSIDPTQLRVSAPALEVTSSRGAEPVAKCIVEHWEKARDFIASSLPEPGFGWVAWVYDVGDQADWKQPTHEVTWKESRRNEIVDVIYLADVTETPGGSQTKFFIGRSDLPQQISEDAVKACQ